VTDRDLPVHTPSRLKADLDALATRRLEIDKVACNKKALSG